MTFFEFFTALREVFGPNVRITQLRLAHIPNFQLGGELQDWMRENPDRVEIYTRGMPGFGRPPDAPQLKPWIPHDTQKRSPKIEGERPA